MKKKAGVLALAGMMALSLLTGCSTYEGIDSEAIIMEVNDEEVTAGVANFYARYTQAQYETYYGAYLGEDMWASEAEEGVTYEQFVKDTVKEVLQVMVLSEQHMKEYGIELSDTENAYIAKQAKEFTQANSQKDAEKVSGDLETVKRVMTLEMITTKVQQAIVADVNTEVADEEAAQKSMDYVFISYTSFDEEGNETALTDAEKADAKAKMEAVSTAAKAGEDFATVAAAQELTPNTVTFDSETSTFEAELIAAADALAEGEVSEAIETATGCYVVKVTSLLDRAATDAKKQEIIEARKAELYAEVTDGWIAESDIKVKDNLWEEIDFKALSVFMTQDETEAYADPVVTDDQVEE